MRGLIALIAVAVLVSVAACSDKTTVSPCVDAGTTGPLPAGCTLLTAECCGGATQTQCNQWGATAGCETSTVVPQGGDGMCMSGCSFTNCSKANPSCTGSTPEAGTD
jgi:hypothetical protein